MANQGGHPDLWLIRHAESANNRDMSRIGGRSPETPLTKAGLWQAERLGRYLRLIGQHRKFTDLWSSTAVRAQQTLRSMLIGMECDNYYTPHESDLLVEYSAGEWEGQPRASIYTNPEIIAAIKREGRNFRPPSGESQMDVSQRFQTWLDLNYALGTQGDRSVLVVTHGMFIRSALITTGHALGDKSVFDPYDVENTSVTRLRRRENGTWQMILFNCTSHLSLPDEVFEKMVTL